MGYKSVNELDIFEFHDAHVKNPRMVNGDFKFEIDYLNIHKHTQQNPGDFDLSINDARMVFRKLRVVTYILNEETTTDLSGNSYISQEYQEYTGEEAKRRFSEELAEDWNLYFCYDFVKRDCFYCTFDCCGVTSFFTITIAFDSAIAEWEDYAGKAWYED